MIKQYFKQAWQLIKENRLFSIIYVAGTALAITMVMVIVIVNYIKTANIYPEYNRDRMMYAKTIRMNPVDTVRFKYSNSGSMSFKAARLLFKNLDTPEKVSVMKSESDFAALLNDDNLIRVKSRFVDINYWSVFNFNFLSGNSFSDADFQSGLQVAVVSESLAKTLFNSADVVGRYFEYGFKPYRICGVVKDVSYLMEETYAQIWMPYTSIKDYDREWSERGGMISGIDVVYILAHSQSDFESIRKEINENVRIYNAQATDWKADLMGQPDIQSVKIHRYWSNEGPDMRKIKKQHFLIIILLLLVPALNLSGMNSTRMERRIGEMGVRKAFGASRSKLTNQILTENLLLTGLGGLAGLIFSYLIMFFTRGWILDIGNQYSDSLPEGVPVDFSPAMLFNGKIFFIVVLVCLMMNVFSALIPVYRSLRKQITDSLYVKYN